MAATGFTPIQLYRTTTPAAQPLAANLADGELAINTADKKLYAKDSAGAVFLLADASSGGTTATNLAGGAAGSVPYQTGANATTFLGIGAAGQVLQVNSGGTAPEWGAVSGTGDVARTTSPSFTTPSLGAATGLSLSMTGQSLTGSSASSTLDMSTTWNTTGTPTAILLDVTDTASNANSLLLDLRTGGTSRFQVSKSGTVLSRGKTIGLTDGTYDVYLERAPSGFSAWGGRLSFLEGDIRWGSSAALTFIGTGATSKWLFDNSGVTASSGGIGVFASHTGSFGFETYGSTTNYAAIASAYTDNSNSGLIFRARSGGTTSEAARITSTGNLGIGTSSPSVKLEVAAGAGFPTAKFTRVGTTAQTGAASIGMSQIGFAGSTNADTLLRSDYGFGLQVNSASSPLTAMAVDLSGNIGLGVTPSAWVSTRKALQIGQSGVLAGSTNSQVLDLVSNAIVNSAGNTVYLVNGFASYYRQFDSVHTWAIAASGTAGAATSFTQAMTLNASGQLAIGTTSAVGKLNVDGAAYFGDDSNNAFVVDSTSSLVTIGAAGRTSFSTSALRFLTSDGSAALERARITSGGDLYVGQTGAQASEQFGVTTTGAKQAAAFRNDDNSKDNIVSWVTTTSGDAQFVGFYTEASPTQRGSITYNRAGGLVAYNITSDYRAKDIIGPVQNPGATIDSLKVYEGVMKGATRSRPMLIAHEAQEHAPYAVSGVKDEVNEDGTPKFQQMDVSSLVPLLLAEIQSLRARVAALEA